MLELLGKDFVCQRVRKEGSKTDYLDALSLNFLHPLRQSRKEKGRARNESHHHHHQEAEEKKTRQDILFPRNIILNYLRRSKKTSHTRVECE